VRGQRTLGGRTPVGLLVFLIALVLPSGAAHGQCERSWVGGFNLWNDPSKWDPFGEPTSADVTCVNQPGVLTVNGGGSVEGLTVGGEGAPATLRIQGYAQGGPAGIEDRSSEIRLASQAGADGIAATGAVVLETTRGGFAWLNGNTTNALVNDGTIRASAAGGGTGPLFLYGDLVNNGTLDIDKSLAQEAHFSDWTNNGVIDIASGASLSFEGSSGSFTQTGSSIVNRGAFIQNAGLFWFTGGTATGNPLELRAVSINATGGAAKLDVTGASNTLVGDIGPNIRLRIRGGVGDARLSSPATRTNNGTLVLETSGAGATQFEASIQDAFINERTIRASGAGGGTGPARFNGDLRNNGTFDIDRNLVQDLSDSDWTNAGLLDIGPAARVDLGDLTQRFTQTSGGTMKVGIDSGALFGRIIQAGAIAVDGRLQVTRKSSFVPISGAFPIIRGSSRTGMFDQVINAVIAGARYLKPRYRSNGVDLVVATASLAVTPASGPPGTQVTVAGSSYPGNDTITIRFTDSAGASRTLAAASTNSAGAFSVTRNVPAAAASGIGEFSARSGITGVIARRNFAVTP
jgi:hypothetical protein